MSCSQEKNVIPQPGQAHRQRLRETAARTDQPRALGPPRTGAAGAGRALGAPAQGAGGHGARLPSPVKGCAWISRPTCRVSSPGGSPEDGHPTWPARGSSAFPDGLLCPRRRTTVGARKPCPHRLSQGTVRPSDLPFQLTS